MFVPGPRRIGATQIVTATFAEDGVLADPNTVAAKVLAPDHTSWTYSYGIDINLTKLDTGSYLLAFTPTMGGRWTIRWEATFDMSGTAVSEDDMIVQASPFFDRQPRDYV